MNEDVQRIDFENWQKGAAIVSSWESWKACAVLKNKHILNGRAYGLNCDKVIKDLEREVMHWKANHQNMVDRARFLHERTDIPVERIETWEEMGRLQDRLEVLAKENRELHIRLHDSCDPKLIKDWILSPPHLRKPAIHAFTEGGNRQVGYLVEASLHTDRVVKEGDELEHKDSSMWKVHSVNLQGDGLNYAYLKSGDNYWNINMQEIDIYFVSYEVARLRQAIKTEAEYCQKFADQYRGEERGLRHQERADRLLKYLEKPSS